MAFYFNHGNMADRMDHHEPASIPSTRPPSISTADHLSQLPPQASVKRGRRDFKITKLFDARSISPHDQPASSAPHHDNSKQLPTNQFGETYNPEDLIFNDAGQVTYVTWRALIIYLTLPEDNMDFMRVFFIGFRLFATSRELAEALVMRANLPPPVSKTGSELRAWRERRLRPIQHKVIQAIRHWLDNAWCAEHDPPCLPILSRFLATEYKNSKHGLSQRECLKLLRRIRELHRSGSPGIESLLAPAPINDLTISQTPSHQLPAPATESKNHGDPEYELLSAVETNRRNHRRLLANLFAHHHHHHGRRHKGHGEKAVDPSEMEAYQTSSLQSIGTRLSEGVPADKRPDHISDPTPVPDISELLMATVGVDLSVEAYRSTHILQVSPMDVACQLTIIESSCFCQIQPMELVNKEFSHGETSLAVNVRQMTKWSTQISRWVSAVILSEATADRRCRALKYFIQLGTQCLALKNYDAVMAIKAAIFCAAVMRLKSTWALLPKKYDVLSKRLHEATDPDRNYANYRALLRRSQPPLLPFMGLYLTDLTFLEDGNPTYRRRSSTDSTLTIKDINRQSQPCTNSEQVDISDPHILINFDKVYRVSIIVKEIAKFQVEYSGNFTLAIPGLQQYLIEQWDKCEREGYDDDKIYEMSLEREP
ncbi:hypothetical protein EC988_005539, partial [Linderina pennispora]